MNQDYRDALSKNVESHFLKLENEIMEDIVRRIRKESEITSTADWQINRLMALGYSSEDVENFIKEALEASYPEIFELYDQVIDWEYIRNAAIYEQVNANFIPYDQNYQLQQLTEAFAKQSVEDLRNITQSLGFYIETNGNRVFTPLAQMYTDYLDQAVYSITTGAFDYNSVIKKTVAQLTSSGLRTIDYASGHSSRVEVATRRAVMTGISKLSGSISEMNAEKLGTDSFEVAWHEGARPTHRVWQGQVWKKEELVSVCGLGSVTGLLGANCYHEYYPFLVGISERTWSDSWLKERNAKEDELKSFKGKQYTLYQAKQRQRQMETAMRAQREKVNLLKAGGADSNDILLAKCKYQGQLGEYSLFSKIMDLEQERARIYMDGLGRIAPKSIPDYVTKEMIKNATKDSAMYSRYKDILGSRMPNLVTFRKIKYNDINEFEKLKRNYNTFKEIEDKNWSLEFKEKAKVTYQEFAQGGIEFSTHGIARFLDRSTKVEKLTSEKVIQLHKQPVNYVQDDGKRLKHYDGIALVYANSTPELVTIVIRDVPKGDWIKSG